MESSSTFLPTFTAEARETTVADTFFSYHALQKYL